MWTRYTEEVVWVVVRFVFLFSHRHHRHCQKKTKETSNFERILISCSGLSQNKREGSSTTEEVLETIPRIYRQASFSFCCVSSDVGVLVQRIGLGRNVIFQLPESCAPTASRVPSLVVCSSPGTSAKASASASHVLSEAAKETK